MKPQKYPRFDLDGDFEVTLSDQGMDLLLAVLNAIADPVMKRNLLELMLVRDGEPNITRNQIGEYIARLLGPDGLNLMRPSADSGPIPDADLLPLAQSLYMQDAMLRLAPLLHMLGVLTKREVKFLRAMFEVINQTNANRIRQMGIDRMAKSML